jgi:hypothetical protein
MRRREDVTVIIPHLVGRREDELDLCVSTIPSGTPYLVADNDGDIAAAMNRALARADTEFVMPFGDDDAMTPDLIDALVAHSFDYDVVYPSMILVDETMETRVGYFEAEPFCPARMERLNFVTGSSLLRARSVRAVGGWEELEWLEDWDLLLRMLRNGATFRPCPKAEFLYRQTPDSRNKATSESGVEEMRKWFRRERIGEVGPARGTWYRQATPAVTYWRCQVPARQLGGIVTGSCEAEVDGEQMVFPNHEGTGVWQFPASNDRALAMLNMKTEGFRTLVEVDDNYLQTSNKTVMDRAGWKKTIEEGDHSAQGHRWCVENADGVIVSTSRLAGIYGKVNPNVYVCPNSVDTADWKGLPKTSGDGKFTIGWFAARSHEADIPLVRRALSWASRQPNVRVVVCGLDPGFTFDYDHLGWFDDIRMYFAAQSIMDVGVCPVTASEWSNCRSDVKALEYGMSGVLPVVSSTPPYETLKGSPALSAATSKEFEKMIRWCVKNQDEAKQLGGEFKQYVLRERTIEKNIHHWEAALDG